MIQRALHTLVSQSSEGPCRPPSASSARYRVSRGLQNRTEVDSGKQPTIFAQAQALKFKPVQQCQHENSTRDRARGAIRAHHWPGDSLPSTVGQLVRVGPAAAAKLCQ